MGKTRTGVHLCMDCASWNVRREQKRIARHTSRSTDTHRHETHKRGRRSVPVLSDCGGTPVCDGGAVRRRQPRQTPPVRGRSQVPHFGASGRTKRKVWVFEILWLSAVRRVLLLLSLSVLLFLVIWNVCEGGWYFLVFAVQRRADDSGGGPQIKKRGKGVFMSCRVGDRGIERGGVCVRICVREGECERGRLQEKNKRGSKKTQKNRQKTNE